MSYYNQQDKVVVTQQPHKLRKVSSILTLRNHISQGGVTATFWSPKPKLEVQLFPLEDDELIDAAIDGDEEDYDIYLTDED